MVYKEISGLLCLCFQILTYKKRAFALYEK